MVRDDIIELALIHLTNQRESFFKRQLPHLFHRTSFQCLSHGTIDHESFHPDLLAFKVEFVHVNHDSISSHSFLSINTIVLISAIHITALCLSRLLIYSFSLFSISTLITAYNITATSFAV